MPTAAPSRRARAGAFTLVELLVTIGIIAVLVSLLVPAVSRARAASLEAACANNLRQMGLAMTQYTLDTQYYPGCWGLSESGLQVAVWPTRLRKYAGGNAGIFWCPAREPGQRWVPTTGTGPGFAVASDQGWGYDLGQKLLDPNPDPQVLGFSYGYNDWGTTSIRGAAADQDRQKGLGGDVFNPLYTEIRLAEVVNPSEMIAIADRVESNAEGFLYNVDPTTPNQYPGAIHRGGANVLFADGHVKWFLQKELVAADPTVPGDVAMNKTWNNDHEAWAAN